VCAQTFFRHLQELIKPQTIRIKSQQDLEVSIMHALDVGEFMFILGLYNANPAWPLALTQEEKLAFTMSVKNTTSPATRPPTPGPLVSFHARLLHWSAKYKASSYTLSDALVLVLTPDHCAAVMAAVHPVLERLYPNLNTQSGVMSNVRGRVEARMQAQGLHRIWRDGMARVVCMRRANRFALTNQQVAVCRQKNESQTRIAFSAVLRAFHTLNNDRHNPYAQVLVINLCAGTRSIEAIRVTQFEQTADASAIHVIGTAKTTQARDRIRPLLFLTAEELVKRVASVRQHTIRCGWYNLDNDALGNRFNAKVNACAAAAFPEHRLTSHRFRELYAQLSFPLQHNMSLPAWISHVLCHKAGSLASTPNYQGLCVVDVNVAELQPMSPPLQAQSVAVAASGGTPASASDRPATVVDALANLHLERPRATTPSVTTTVQVAHSQRKRKRKSNTAAYVVLRCGDGKRRKVASNPKVCDKKTLQRCQESKVELASLGIPPEYSMLRSLGYSDRIIQQAARS
jgi:integrase